MALMNTAYIKSVSNAGTWIILRNRSTLSWQKQNNAGAEAGTRLAPNTKCRLFGVFRMTPGALNENQCQPADHGYSPAALYRQSLGTQFLIDHETRG